MCVEQFIVLWVQIQSALAWEELRHAILHAVLEITRSILFYGGIRAFNFWASTHTKREGTLSRMKINGTTQENNNTEFWITFIKASVQWNHLSSTPVKCFCKLTIRCKEIWRNSAASSTSDARIRWKICYMWLFYVLE